MVNGMVVLGTIMICHIFIVFSSISDSPSPATTIMWGHILLSRYVDIYIYIQYIDIVLDIRYLVSRAIKTRYLLTCAAEPLPAHPRQDVETQVAVRGLKLRYN